MTTTNVPAITWVNGAPVLPTEADILAGVQADQVSAFGGALNPGLTTPQGQLAQSQTAIIGEKDAQVAYFFNQIDPDNAEGAWQDAIGRIYFLSRTPAEGTVVDATCIGAVGTIIPAGSLARDGAGYLYASTSAATIPAGGSVVVQFQNQIPGAIPCGIGALATIYTAIAGWDTISNPAAGALGSEVESRAAFELRRRQSVAGNSKNSNQSILGAVLGVAGVIDAMVVDNPTNASVSHGSTSFPIAANSVCASVAGGSGADVARAIWTKKPPGCSYVGDTTEIVYDTDYTAPQPQYSVTWLTPTATPVYFKIQIRNNTLLPSNVITLVRESIINAFSGLDGGIRSRIGGSTFSGRYYAGITAINPNLELLSVLIGLTLVGATETTLSFGIDQLPVIDAAYIEVTLV